MLRMKIKNALIWAIKSALYTPNKDPQRVSKYKNIGLEIDEALKNISFPVELTSIEKFEKKSSISINVYSYEIIKGRLNVYILYHTKNKQQRHVNLLLIKNENQTHYCWIKDLSRLISNQSSKHDGKIFSYDRCLRIFYCKEKLDEHEELCKDHKAVKIVMPKPKSNIKFKNYNHSLRVPFVIYADFECLLHNINTCQPNPEKSYINKYQKHYPISFTYYVKYSNGYYKKPVTYIGEDASKVFVEMMKKESIEIKKVYDKIIPMKKLTKQELIDFKNAKTCHICGYDFNEKDKKVRDHDHLTGKYRGAAHNECNLNYNNPTFLPVYIHNLANYDVHLFIKELGYDKENIDVIPNNEEKYISFSKNVKDGIKLRFLDTFKFMASSIDALSSNLKKEQFRETTKHFPNELLDLVIKKGVYPYEYMDDIKKFEENKLPDKKYFYSRLNKSDISDDEYNHAKIVWEKFNIKNLEEYTRLYNETDVLILADIFENFRDVCLKTYKLDLSWYFTAPGLS